MTISWSFSNGSFVKIHVKKDWEPQHNRVLFKSALKWDVFKGPALYKFMYAMSLCFGLKQNVTYIIEHNSRGPSLLCG